MDKSTSILAAFEAGKLPSTQQTNAFIDWLSDVGISRVEPASHSEFSAQGRVLAGDLRGVLDAYKQLGSNKNADNILQQAIWHLTEGDLTVTADAEAGKEQAIKDLNELRASIRTLLSILWSGVSSEGTSLVQDLLSVVRLSLADAAEALEGQAGSAKDGLRRVEEGVQGGERDALGRDKKRLEEEKDAKVAWQHGMDTVKDAGTGVIGTAQGTAASVRETADKTSSRLQDAFYKVSDRAQSDPEYRQALDKLFSILQARLDSTIDAAADPNTTLSSLVADPTPEQHIPKALGLLRTLVERLANTPLEPLIQKTRSCANEIIQDKELKAWFDDFFKGARKALAEPGYARSEEAKGKRKEMRVRWRTLLEKDEKWKAAVDGVKAEFGKVQDGLECDGDLNRVKEAHKRFGEDVERGLVEAGEEAQTGMQAAVEQATWFWQDLFKVYIPRFLSKMRDVPIPRTEYKDQDIEFVLENLDISSFNILPSHVYIRNITDVDIQTSASASTPSRTAIGALTHIKIQALQLALKDVSFWYKDKNAMLGPSEFTGLLALSLPEKGVSLDLKVRLIPEHTKGSDSRQTKRHFHVVEKAEVTIAEDVQLAVRESNHAVLVTVFQPIMKMRLKEALEKTLSEQIRAVVDYADGVAFDVAQRRQVFEDTGLGGGAALMAALWSEVGRLEREGREGQSVDWKATGTGVVLEQTRVEGEEEKKTAVAMGAEPQILSGEKRGPLGTGSEPLKDKFERVSGELGAKDAVQAVSGDVDMEGIEEGAKGLAAEVQDRAERMVKEGRRQVAGFRRSVERKKGLEEGRGGWESAAFDV